MEEIIKGQIEMEGVANPQGNNIDYIEALKKMRENSVTKEEFDQVKSENKRLIEAIVSGTSGQIEESEPVDIQKLRNEMFCEDSDLSNLEYIEKALKLRQAILDKTGQDIFLPVGNTSTASIEDRNAAQEVAQVFEECIEFAKGDSGVFTAELMRRTVDTNINKYR